MQCSRQKDDVPEELKKNRLFNNLTTNFIHKDHLFGHSNYAGEP